MAAQTVPVRVPQLLLPATTVDLHRWAVIACDQFTSQPEYWAEVEKVVGEAPSTLRMVLPELHLGAPDVDARVRACQDTMAQYLDDGVLVEEYALILVERTHSGGVQHGLMVELDLEAYDFDADATAPIRSTEGTVLDRLPPRMAVRREAALELPHIMVLYDDPEGHVLAPVLAGRDAWPVAYDVDLMLGSGHVTGRLVRDAGVQDAVFSALAGLVAPEAYRDRYDLPADDPLLFAMGDGNHSLATARSIWAELKAAGAASDHPARWALVELVNLHDASLTFEPIHRVLFDGVQILDGLPDALGATRRPVGTLQEAWDAITATGPTQRIGVVSEDGHAVLEVAHPSHELAVGTLQAHVDAWLADRPEVEIDYVHGEDVTATLGARPGNVAFLLPGIGKDAFFRSIAVDGPMPRKTFSMGHAQDKRFYLEARAIR